MRGFWPVSEAAQHDYEALRNAALEGIPLLGGSADRFERKGLAGLIVRPSSSPRFGARLVGAQRPPWTPHDDPREEVLAHCYGYLLDASGFQRVLLREVT